MIGTRPVVNHTTELAQATVCFDNDTIVVDGDLDFDSVVELDSAARTWLQNKQRTSITVDLSAVSFCNSAGVALLLGWMREAKKLGSALVLTGVPADLIAMAEVSGLSALFAVDPMQSAGA